jgi:hypothetical protein
MRKIITIIILFLGFVSCQKLENLNTNTKDPSTVPGETLFTYGEKKLFDQMVNSNVNYNIFRLLVQQWTETTYLDESNYDLVTRTIPDDHWDRLYRDVLKNFNESAKVLKATSVLTASDSAVKANKLAIVEVLTVYTYSILVETFGNIPYTQALNDSISLPKYDDGLTVYEDLISRLNTALVTLNKNSTSGSFDAADNVYSGDVPSWIKFANSLKLKMGLVLSDVDDETTKAFVKTTVESAAPNVFTSSSDDANFIYLSTQPNANQIYVDLVASGRHDFVPANTLVDVLNNLNDPRLTTYFANPVAFHYRKENGTKQDSVVPAGGIGRLFLYLSADGTYDSTVYKTAPYTINAADSVNVEFYIGGTNGVSSSYSKYSHVADIIQTATFPGTILDYPEVEFLLAEAVARGYNVTGTVADHYRTAIINSITHWGGTESAANTYYSSSAVTYETATGTWRQKIGIQKWIALYNRGFEAWTEYRRFGYPELVAPPAAQSVIPLRFTYPIEEQTLNPDNYKAASAAIGGDDVGTRLFWNKSTSKK